MSSTLLARSDCLGRSVEMDPGGRDLGGEAFDQCAYAGAQSGEDGRAGCGWRGCSARVPLSDECCDQGAVGALHLHENGEGRACGEGVHVSSENSSKEGSRDAVKDFGAEVPEGEGSDGFVLGGDGREKLQGAAGFGAVGGDGRGREERGVGQAVKIGRDHKSHAVGHRQESWAWVVGGAEINPCLAKRVVGWEEVGGEPEVGGEIGGPRLGSEPGVGSRFDDESTFTDGLDDAAKSI